MVEKYIEVEAKSDDGADPNPVIYGIYEDIPLSKEELRQQYYPFFEEAKIRYIGEGANP